MIKNNRTRAEISHTQQYCGAPSWKAGNSFLASWKRFDSLQGEKVNLFCLALPSAIQNSFFPYFSSATDQTCGGMLIVVCVFPFVFVINAVLLFLYGIIVFVYAH